MPLEADDIADLYARHARRLVAFFARRTFDTEVAVELMAETFAIAVAGGGRCRASTPDDAVAWLYSIAHGRFSNWLRDLRVERRVLSQVGLEPPQLADAELDRVDELAGTAELRAQVARRLDALAPGQQAAVRLRIVEELPYEDVATRLGVSEQTARARVSRALRALGAALSEAGDDA